MIDPNNYYMVQGWMLSELGLKGNALGVYAIIYGFSQDGSSEYSGSARYLSEWLGCSQRTILSTLASLTEQGLLIKRTTYKNGLTFNSYTAVKNTPESAGENVSYPMKKFHGGHENFSGGDVKKFHGGHENFSDNNDRDIYRNINIEINKESNNEQAAPGSPPPPDKDKKPVKHKYGEYKNVLLTDEELDKLRKLFPDDLEVRIERLSEYIASTGKSYKSHYATIRAWANRDKKEAPAAAGRGRRRATVGPNGIAIDPTKTDLDELFV